MKSITLWELTGGPVLPPEEQWPERPSYWPKKPSLRARAARLARLGLIAGAILSTGGGAGIFAFYVNDVPDVLLVAWQEPQPAVPEPLPVAAEPAPAKPAPRLAAHDAQPPVPVPLATAAAGERLAALLDAARFEPVQPASGFILPPRAEPAPMLEIPVSADRNAPLPRARPDEPVTTGSIRAAAPDSPEAAPRRRFSFSPCAALKTIKVAFLLGNRCARSLRAAPPPRRADPVQAASSVPAAPRPYQPPRVVED